MSNFYIETQRQWSNNDNDTHSKKWYTDINDDTHNDTYIQWHIQWYTHWLTYKPWHIHTRYIHAITHTYIDLRKPSLLVKLRVNIIYEEDLKG